MVFLIEGVNYHASQVDKPDDPIDCQPFLSILAHDGVSRITLDLSDERERKKGSEGKNQLNNFCIKPSVNRWYALAVLFLVYVTNQVDRQIMGILLEPIKHEMGASDTQMGFLVGFTFALFYASMGIPIALLADLGNRRNIIA